MQWLQENAAMPIWTVSSIIQLSSLIIQRSDILEAMTLKEKQALMALCERQTDSLQSKTVGNDNPDFGDDNPDFGALDNILSGTHPLQISHAGGEFQEMARQVLNVMRTKYISPLTLTFCNETNPWSQAFHLSSITQGLLDPQGPCTAVGHRPWMANTSSGRSLSDLEFQLFTARVQRILQGVYW